MCLDHIIAHETYHFFHAQPLNLLPHVSSNNVGHSELKNPSTHGEVGCKQCSMYNRRYMSHVNYIEHVQIKSFIYKKKNRHIFDKFNKKQRQIKPKRIQENDQTFSFLFKNAFFGLILKKTSTFIFWCMIILLGPHSVYT